MAIMNENDNEENNDMKIMKQMSMKKWNNENDNENNERMNEYVNNKRNENRKSKWNNEMIMKT